MASAQSPELARAVTFLGWFYEAAKKIDRASNMAEWVDPDAPGPDDYRYVRDAVLATAIERWNNFSVNEKREIYKRQLAIVISTVQAASCLATLKLLRQQGLNIGLLQLGVSSFPKLISNAAVEAKKYAATTTLPILTREEYLEITQPSRQADSSFAKRIRRTEYLHAIRVLGDKPQAKSAADASIGLRYLSYLVVHPRGVDLVDKFAEGSPQGAALATDLINKSNGAIQNLQIDLGEDSSKVWHFPPGLIAGLRELSLDRDEAVVHFSLAWSASRQDSIERAIVVAGNALLILGHLGVYGRAAAAILSVILGAVETTLSYLRELEQEQAADATTFATNPAEKLSQGASYLGTALLGASTLAAGLIGYKELAQMRSGLAQGSRRVAQNIGKGLAKEDVIDPRGALNRGTIDRLNATAQKGIENEVTNVARGVTAAGRVESGVSAAESQVLSTTPRGTMTKPALPKESTSTGVLRSSETSDTAAPRSDVMTTTSRSATPTGRGTTEESRGLPSGNSEVPGSGRQRMGMPRTISRIPPLGTPQVVKVSHDLPEQYLDFREPLPEELASGQHKYLVDQQDRPLKAQGYMYSNAGGSRTAAQAAMTGRGAPYYGLQASHLMPDFGGGSGEWFNLVPLESEVNKSQIASIEAFIRNRSKSGDTLYVQVYVRYNGANRIPSELTYRIYRLEPSGLKQLETRVVGGQVPIFFH